MTILGFTGEVPPADPLFLATGLGLGQPWIPGYKPAANFQNALVDRVLRWLEDQDPQGLYLSTVTIAEIIYGIQALPDGRRSNELQDRFWSFVERGFEQRTLDFDTPAAAEYGRIMAQRRKTERPMSVRDGQIAAITLRHRMALATRNTRDFEDCGLELIDPFAQSG